MGPLEFPGFFFIYLPTAVVYLPNGFGHFSTAASEPPSVIFQQPSVDSQCTHRQFSSAPIRTIESAHPIEQRHKSLLLWKTAGHPRKALPIPHSCAARSSPSRRLAFLNRLRPVIAIVPTGWTGGALSKAGKYAYVCQPAAFSASGQGPCALRSVALMDGRSDAALRVRHLNRQLGLGLTRVDFHE